jgi:cytochrome c5
MSCPPAAPILACVIALVHPAAQADEARLKLKEAIGRDVVSAHCSICHSLDYIPMNAPVMTPDRWQASLHKMIEKMGAPIDETTAAKIQQYLSTQYSDAPR